jgi:hypothetical protein
MITILLSALALFLSAETAYALDITTCGEVVTRRDPGVLQADLNCSGTGAAAVSLMRGATLDLNGHTIVGGPLAPTIDSAGSTADPGVPRPASFTVRGPGVVAGTAEDAFPFRNYNACINLRDGRGVITSATGVVEIYGCEYGIWGGTKGPDLGGRGRATIDHVNVHDNFRAGVSVRKLIASDTTAHHHARDVALTASKYAEVTNVLVHHNSFGLGAKKLVATDLSAIDNQGDPSSGQGVYTEHGVLTRFVAHGNTNPGIGGTYVKLIDSTVTGNGLQPPHLNVDIQTAMRPVLVNTVCLHSEVALSDRPLPPTYPNWGVCSED